MNRYIVHPGTGTILSADDDLYLITTDIDFDDLEYNLDSVIEESGVPVSIIIDKED